MHASRILGSQFNDHVNGMQAASYADGDALHSCNHEILQRLAGLVHSEARYLALGGLLRKLLHPDINARATVQEALADDSFWTTA